MVIESIEVHGVAVPLAGAYSTSYQSTSEQRSAIVRIVASDGTVGLGNVDPVPGYSEESTEDTLAALAGRSRRPGGINGRHQGPSNRTSCMRLSSIRPAWETSSARTSVGHFA